MQIKSLRNISFDKIFEAFSSAFADYEMQLNKEELEVMLHRRGFESKISFAAFEGNDIVSFTLNGTGLFNGKLTAYDTGTGTVKKYRGKGLATKIFEHSIPFLKKENIEQYLLEVLQHNSKAVSIYKNIGFNITREFNYFSQDVKTVNLKTPYRSTLYEMKEIDLDRITSLIGFWDFYPSWQNSFAAIQRKPDDFIIRGIFSKQKPIGYCVSEPISGDITQIAVDKNHRRQGVASLLLREAIKSNRHDFIKIINTDTNCESITKFLESKNIMVKGKQFEMIRKI